jgi:hypothetical protein
MCVRIESVGKNKEVTEDCYRRETKTPSTTEGIDLTVVFYLSFFRRRKEEKGIGWGKSASRGQEEKRWVEKKRCKLCNRCGCTGLTKCCSTRLLHCECPFFRYKWVSLPPPTGELLFPR